MESEVNRLTVFSEFRDAGKAKLKAIEQEHVIRFDCLMTSRGIFILDVSEETGSTACQRRCG